MFSSTPYIRPYLIKQSHAILFVGLYSFSEHEIDLFDRLTKAGYENTLLFLRTSPFFLIEGYRFCTA